MSSCLFLHARSSYPLSSNNFLLVCLCWRWCCILSSSVVRCERCHSHSSPEGFSVLVSSDSWQPQTDCTPANINNIKTETIIQWDSQSFNLLNIESNYWNEIARVLLARVTLEIYRRVPLLTSKIHTIIIIPNINAWESTKTFQTFFCNSRPFWPCFFCLVCCL